LFLYYSQTASVLFVLASFCSKRASYASTKALLAEIEKLSISGSPVGMTGLATYSATAALASEIPYSIIFSISFELKFCRFEEISKNY